MNWAQKTRFLKMKGRGGKMLEAGRKTLAGRKFVQWLQKGICLGF